VNLGKFAPEGGRIPKSGLKVVSYALGDHCNQEEEVKDSQGDQQVVEVALEAAPAEDSDGKRVCNDADDGHDEGGMPTQVQVDLTQQVKLLPCRILTHPCLVTSHNILLLMEERCQTLKENQGKL